MSGCYIFFFFFNDTATTEIYTLSLHDALPICSYTYQAKANVGGTDHFVYSIKDGDGDLSTTTLDITVNQAIATAHGCTPVTPIARMPSSACVNDLVPWTRTGSSAASRAATNTV